MDFWTRLTDKELQGLGKKRDHERLRGIPADYLHTATHTIARMRRPPPDELSEDAKYDELKKNCQEFAKSFALNIAQENKDPEDALYTAERFFEDQRDFGILKRGEKQPSRRTEGGAWQTTDIWAGKR